MKAYFPCYNGYCSLYSEYFDKWFIRTILIMNLTNTKHEDIFKRFYAFKLTILILGIAIFFLVIYSYLSDNLVLLCCCAVLVYFLLALMIYANYFITSQMREILFTLIEFDKYQKYFEYAYRHTFKQDKKAGLQESYLADAQYHYFRGEFEQSLQSLNEINIKKARWRRRKVLLTSLSYYRMLNKINQKDFSDFEDRLALYRKMKGKNVPERSAKLLAIYRVVSGQATDYFEKIAPKYKLHQIEAKYYTGLSYLNQTQPEEAKACFREIANENSDLFYVREAKKYLEELAF